MLHFSLFATPKPAFIVAYDYLAHWHDLGVALKLISLFGLFISFYDISVVKPLSHASDSLPYIKAVRVSCGQKVDFNPFLEFFAATKPASLPKTLSRTKNLRRLSQPIT